MRRENLSRGCTRASANVERSLAALAQRTQTVSAQVGFAACVKESLLADRSNLNRSERGEFKEDHDKNIEFSMLHRAIAQNACRA
jgi:hypothetical protein